jgi:hypothetical protein
VVSTTIQEKRGLVVSRPSGFSRKAVLRRVGPAANAASGTKNRVARRVTAVIVFIL